MMTQWRGAGRCRGSRARVKGAPTAGWFFPAALAGDLDDVYAPSDYPHFAAGTHGNAATANPDPGSLLELQNARGVLNADCVAAQKPNQWWACASHRGRACCCLGLRVPTWAC